MGFEYEHEDEIHCWWYFEFCCYVSCPETVVIRRTDRKCSGSIGTLIRMAYVKTLGEIPDFLCTCAILVLVQQSSTNNSLRCHN